MSLYWGVRGERDLYARGLLEELARRTPRLKYLPVLSEPSEQWQGARGLVHEAVLRDVPDLANHEVYAAGPPAMIAAVRRDFELHGLEAGRLHFDSFDYAPDSLERQRNSAATRS
jgi:CDP-4-dehydro-6-deoxyglucose reductase